MDTLDFQPMLITDVFESMRASQSWYDKNKLRPGAGTYPYISRSALKNGHEGVVKKQDLPPNPGNAITIGVDTQTVFYQPMAFYTSVKIQVLRHPELSPINGPLLVAILRQQMSKFQWGNGASLVRLRATRIMVPVITGSNGGITVDWDGLTKLGNELLRHTVTNIRPTLTTTPCGDPPTLELAFKPMFITDVFDSMRASKAWYDKTKLSTEGRELHPFVSRTKVNNGVDSFCRRQEKEPEPGNAITIGLDTQTIGYQPVPFYTSQNIQVLRHKHLDEYSALVLATLINQQMSKFSWGGNGATLGRLKRTRIMVPVTIDDHGAEVVDWRGMSQYGRELRAQTEKSTSTLLEPPP